MHAAAVVDDRSGLVSTPVPGPGPWPLGAAVPRFRARVRALGADVTVSGCALDDSPAAYAACLGEAAERYAALVPRRPERIASPAELRAGRVAHLTPGALGVEPELGADLPMGWLRSADDRLVPRNAVLGHLSPFAAPADEGCYPHGSTGLAAARTWSDAVAAACAEVIERDAVARAWTGAASFEEAALPPRLARLGEEQGLDAVALRVPVVDGSAVSMVGLRHHAQGLIGVGAAYRTDPGAGLTKAWLEAVVSIAQAREVADPKTGPPLVAAAGIGPWRADRCYAAAGWRHVTDLTGQLLLLLDPTVQDRVWDRLSAGGREHREPGAPAAAANESPRLLVRRLFGEVVDVDLTPPDLARLGGVVVVRVLATGARVVRPAGLAPDELPCPLV